MTGCDNEELICTASDPTLSGIAREHEFSPATAVSPPHRHHPDRRIRRQPSRLGAVDPSVCQFRRSRELRPERQGVEWEVTLPELGPKDFVRLKVSQSP